MLLRKLMQLVQHATSQSQELSALRSLLAATEPLSVPRPSRNPLGPHSLRHQFNSSTWHLPHSLRVPSSLNLLQTSRLTRKRHKLRVRVYHQRHHNKHNLCSPALRCPKQQPTPTSQHHLLTRTDPSRPLLAHHRRPKRNAPQPHPMSASRKSSKAHWPTSPRSRLLKIGRQDLYL